MERCPGSGKLIYHAKGKAEASLRDLRSKNGYSGEVYPCPCCSGFHIGRRKKNAHGNKYRH